MISLYDYLGKPAGKELGLQVSNYAKLRKAKFGKRFIANSKYTGIVILYEKEFLSEFFETQKIFNT
jgi:hypothetical protein